MSLSSSSVPVKDVLQAARKIPAFPDVVWKVMPLLRKMAPPEQIESVIKYDPALTAKVLAISRSPHYARLSKVNSLRDAIVRLGQQQLIQILMTACASRYFNIRGEGYELAEGELWEHALATALIAEKIGRTLQRKNLMTIYMAALLHDIGKTVLTFYVSNYSSAISSLVEKEGLTFLEAEQRVIGIDHQALGGIIAREWRFPADIVIPIEHHHSPEKVEEHRDVVEIVYLANRLVASLGIGAGLDGFLQFNQDHTFESLGITPRMAEQFMVDVVEMMDEVRHFLGD